MALSVVTGANRGIGLSLCEQLKARGKTVLAACRKASPELLQLGVELAEDIDVTTQAGALALAKAVGIRQLELLINNAGILRNESLGSIDFDSIERQFATNAIGPVRITETLAPRLSSGAKVAMITSRMGSIADNGSGGYYGYRMSKAALNAASVSLARDLKARGIALAILHPGYVATEMTGRHGSITPSEAAAGLLARIDALTLETSGSFWHMNGEPLPW